jgi:phage-related protein
MSLFYNRDRNITDVEQITSMFAINPNYGSTVSFVCKNNRVDYNNNTFSIMPSTLNNVTANCSFNFTTNEEQAKKIVNFFESQSGTGYFGIADSSLIYQTLYGFANSFDISMEHNNLYNISLNFSVERNASVLDWSGMSFVNYLFEEWQIGKAYSKYQPVYFETQKDNLIKNFFYAKESHTSSLDKAPTSEEYWTQEFFFEDDLGLKVSTEPTIDFLNFKNSFPQRIKSQDNIHTFRKLDLGFKNLSDFKLKSMLHFLESHLGYLKFQFNCPKIYNRPKIFYAESWTHTWNYKDSHNLTVTLAEDPLGILNQIDSPDVSLFQDTADSSISLDAFSEDGIFIIDFSGKKQTVENGLFSENWAGQGRTLKLYQQLNSVSCTEQDLRKISFGNRVELKTGDFSQNSISEVNFNSSKKIEYLNLSGNLINNFSCLNVTGLKYINLNDNNLTGANFSGCNNLTGVFIQKTGNVISQSSLGTILNGVGNGDGISGTIRCSGSVSGSSSLLSKVSNLDYRKWTQEYSGLSLPMNPSSYSNGANVFWYENSQALETGESYFLKWFSSKQENTLVQTYTPNSPDWFVPVVSQIGQRAAFNFHNTYLTGTGISNTGDFLAVFSVLSLSDNNYQCIANFSDSKKYGIFASGASLYFINGTEFSQISSALDLNSYYSVGFVRNSTHFTGFINGSGSNTGLISVSNLSSIKPSVGASYLQNDFFNGKIAELLVYSKNSQPYLTNTGELNFLFNSKFGIVV